MADTSWLAKLFSSPNATAPAPRGIGPQGQSLVSSLKESAAPAMESANNLFENPNFLKFLADTGAELDPEGAGGALGRPTSQWIERQQTGEALSQQDKIGNKQMEKLLEYLSGGSNLTGMKISPDGTLELKGAAGEQGAAAPKETALKKEGDSLGEMEDEPDEMESLLDNILAKLNIGG